MVAMSDLRDLPGALGYAGARSPLQSGNLVFESDWQTGAELECFREAQTAGRLGVTAAYVVRTAAEWSVVIARNPFPAEGVRDPGGLLVMFLKAAPRARDVQALQAAIEGPEYLRAVGKHLYVVYPAEIGRWKLTGNRIDKSLGARGTGRNRNTVLEVTELCA
jgi:uncharacterized protein (DUF1697 family)